MNQFRAMQMNMDMMNSMYMMMCCVSALIRRYPGSRERFRAASPCRTCGLFAVILPERCRPA